MSGCRESEVTPLPSQAAQPSAVRFTDVTAQAGIDFVHTSGRSGRKYGVETIGSGAAFLDYDNDSYIDLYIVNGASLPGHTTATSARNFLYRNQGGTTFAEVAAEVGIADSSYGMGCAVGDLDNDGDEDLFVANFGPNILYRNDGDSGAGWRFADITAQTVLAQDDGWSTGCALADYDLDGDLDLYVASYLEYRFEADDLDNGGQLRRPRRHLAPTEYPARRNFLYRNDGENRFTDVAREAGLSNGQGRALGAVFFDFDLDGDPDLFQANDATPNALYRNDGNGTFDEIGLEVGVAYNEAGKPEGCMGVDIADLNSDGYMDLATTNFQWESNTLYLSDGQGAYRDRSAASGLGTTSLNRLAFGINLFDVEADGDQDLYVANGHIDENIEVFDPQATYGQPDHLYLNNGQGHFADIADRAGPYFKRRMVGRGSAVGDYDNDGDLDLLIVNTNQPAVLLRNDTPRHHHWLTLRLKGTLSNRSGLGARITVESGDMIQHFQTRSAASFLSQNDPRLFVGLGQNQHADRIEIIWPSGIHQRLENVPAGQVLHIEEPGEGQPLSHRAPVEKSRPDSTVALDDLEAFWRAAPPALPHAGRLPPPRAVPDLDALQKRAAQSPDDSNTRYALAEALRQLRRYHEAEPHYKQAIALDDKSAASHTGLGQLYSALGDLSRAVDAFKKAIDLDSQSADPHYYLGNIYTSQSRFAQAVDYYEKTLHCDPRYLQAYVNLAGIHARQTDYGLAIQTYERGFEALPNNPELIFQLGWVYFAQGRFDLARTQFERVLLLDPDRLKTYELLAQIYLNEKETAAARRLLQQGLEYNPDDPALRARLGILLLEAGEGDQAIGHLKAAIERDPDHAEAYYNLSQAYSRAGRPERGRSLLTYFKKLQDQHQVLLDLKTAISLNPNDAEAWYNLGVIYTRIGRYEAARQAYSAALVLKPHHVDARNNLGNIYLRQRRLNQAIETYSAVLRQDSSYVRTYNNLAKAHLLAGQAARAIEIYERAIAIDPNYAPARANLGKLYLSQGRRAEGEAQLARHRALTGKEGGR